MLLYLLGLALKEAGLTKEEAAKRIKPWFGAYKVGRITQKRETDGETYI